MKFVLKIVDDKTFTKVFTDSSCNAGMLNQKLAEAGIFVSYLKEKQDNLEIKFLNMIKNK